MSPETVDELANRFGPTGEFDKLATALDGLDHRSLPAKEAEAWFHTRGVAEWRQGHPEAMEWFEEGLNRFPDSGILAFSLGQELENRGRWEEARATFGRVRLGASPAQQTLGLAAVTAPYVMTIVRYCYLWGAFDDGQRHLDPLFEAYKQFRIADDTFLYLRGLPFASEVLATRCGMAILSGEPRLAESTLEWAANALVEIDLSYDRAILEGWVRSDWSPAIGWLGQRLSKRPGDVAGSFDAYMAMNLATIQSRFADSLEAGRQLLDQVALGPQDFAWLEDIRTLALSGLAHRFHEPAVRERAEATFLSHQALLFEPHHVFNFGMLDVQEPLRAAYQVSRRTRATEGHRAG